MALRHLAALDGGRHLANAAYPDVSHCSLWQLATQPSAATDPGTRISAEAPLPVYGSGRGSVTGTRGSGASLGVVSEKGRPRAPSAG